MKISKLFCIDLDIYEKLSKIDNHSKLINDLLKDYFSTNSGKSDLISQKTEQIKLEKAKMKKIKADLKLLNTINKSNFDQYCINWCHSQEFKMEDDVIFNYVNRRRLKIKVEEFKKLAELVLKNEHLFKKTG